MCDLIMPWSLSYLIATVLAAAPAFASSELSNCETYLGQTQYEAVIKAVARRHFFVARVAGHDIRWLRMQYESPNGAQNASLTLSYGGWLRPLRSIRFLIPVAAFDQEAWETENSSGSLYKQGLLYTLNLYENDRNLSVSFDLRGNIVEFRLEDGPNKLEIPQTE